MPPAAGECFVQAAASLESGRAGDGVVPASGQREHQLLPQRLRWPNSGPIADLSFDLPKESKGPLDLWHAWSGRWDERQQMPQELGRRFDLLDISLLGRDVQDGGDLPVRAVTGFGQVGRRDDQADVLGPCE